MRASPSIGGRTGYRGYRTGPQGTSPALRSEMVWLRHRLLPAAVVGALPACAGVLGLDPGVADPDAGGADAWGLESSSLTSLEAQRAGDLDAAFDAAQTSGLDAPGPDYTSMSARDGGDSTEDALSMGDGRDGMPQVPAPDAGDGSAGCGFTACPDGCHDTSSDPQHCGGCTTPCPFGVNSRAICTGGGCSIACTSGALDCDHDPANGCECAATPANGSLVCNANGTCGHICDQGYVDCGGRACSCGAADRCLSDGTCGACRASLQACQVGTDCCSGSCGAGLTCL